MSEISIASARASVMVYDDMNKKWIPSGTSSGLSKVHIFQHSIQNTFRVVGRKLHDHEVVINCIILRSLKYNQATPTFHQWRDNKLVYGLNFSSKEDADTFAKAMIYAVEVMSGIRPPTQPQLKSPNALMNSMNQQLIMNGSGGLYEEDMGYRNYYDSHQYNVVAPKGQQSLIYSNVDFPHHARTMTKEDMAILQERRMSQQSQSALNSPGSVSNASMVSVSPQQNSGHQRTSSAPPAPQPPPQQFVSPGQQQQQQQLQQQQQQQQQQQLSQISAQSTVPAPPCPPPMPTGNSLSKSNEPEVSSLASQLQSARLRRSNRQSAENSGSSTSSGGSNYGTLGRNNQSSMASMMDEMAKTLARRRAAVEKKDMETNEEPATTNGKKVSWCKPTANGCESPKPLRKQFSSNMIEETPPTKVNGDTTPSSLDLESFKQEILREIRGEFARAKLELIEAVKAELSRK